MLDLPPKHWRNPQPMKFEEIKKKRDDLEAKWGAYDWTKIAKRRVDQDDE